MVKVENLTLTYNNRKVLDNINISVNKGEIVTILGPNGGGKTSLVKAIVGVNKCYTGNITLMNNIRINYMPQNFSINNLMPITVEYFLLNSFTTKIKKGHSFIADVVELVGIQNILNSQVLEISSGQTQLLLLARCLITEPDLIILDEPVSSMDITARVKFYNIISKLAAERSISILMTSHDLYSVVPCSDYVVCINNTIYYQGKTDKNIADKFLTEIFSSYK